MKQRYLDLLSVLEPVNYKTSIEIAKQLSVSNKTVQKSLKELDEYLQGNGAAIEVKHRTGYRLIIKDPGLYQAFLNNPGQNLPSDASERMYYILKRLMESQEYLRLSDLEEELYVSRNTLSACMKKAGKILEKYHLSLERRARYGLRIQGTEIHKRRFVTTYLREQDILVERKMTEAVPRLSKIIRNSLRRQNFSISDFALNNLIIHLHVAITRMKESQYISGETLNVKELQEQPEYEIAVQLAADLEQELNLKIPEPEIAYITIHLAGKHMQTAKQVNNVVIKPEISVIVDEMLIEIYKKTNFDFRNDLELKMALCQHLIALEMRAKYHMELKNPLLEEVKRSYPAAFAIAIEASVVLNRRFHTRLSEHEIGYIAFSFALAQERRESSMVKKNILLVCATGKGSAKLLQYKYEKEFGDCINKPVCCDATELEEIDFTNIDYVITTVPIYVNVPRPILEVQYFLDQQEISNLRAALFEEAKAEQVMQFYPEDLFIPHLNAGSRDEAIDKMCRHIAARRPIPENFRELVMQREAAARTEFGNLVAMPHPSDNVTEETFVCVAILNQPVIWEDKKVQVVFLVSIERELKKSIQSFYHITAEFFLNRDCINGLIKNRSYQWFQEKIEQLEE